MYIFHTKIILHEAVLVLQNLMAISLQLSFLIRHVLFQMERAEKVCLQFLDVICVNEIIFDFLKILAVNDLLQPCSTTNLYISLHASFVSIQFSLLFINTKIRNQRPSYDPQLYLQAIIGSTEENQTVVIVRFEGYTNVT